MSTKRVMREERQQEDLQRINGQTFSVTPNPKYKPPRAVPWCGCGARDGYHFDPSRQMWVCARCECPSKGWIDAQSRDSLTPAVQEEMRATVVKYRRIKAKSDSEPKDQVYLNKKNVARGIIRGLAVAISMMIDPHQHDLDRVMEIEKEYMSNG